METIDPYKPISISKIEISGNNRTREAFFQNEFSDSVQSQNISELHQNLSIATQRLKLTGLFEGIDANIKICSSLDAKSNGDSTRKDVASPYNIAIDVTVKEVGVPQIKMESYIQTGSGVNSGGGALQASLRNPLGYGEVCKLSLGSNTSEGQECSLVTMVPHFSFPNPNATLIRPIFHSIFGSKSLSADGKMAESVKSDSTQRGTLQFSFKKSEENNSHFVSFKSLLHTIGTEFTSDNGVHSISTEITVRDELPISHRFQPQSNILRDFQKNLFSKNPIAVREVPCVYNAHAKTASKETLSNLSSSSKTALQYTYLKDCRNTSNPILGSYLKSSIEVALPSGSQSAQYVRTDVMMQNNFRVIPFEGIDTGMTASYSGSIGALWPLPGVNRLHAFLVDRYHAGGPMSLRGFEGYGIGPRAPLSGALDKPDTAEQHGNSLGGFTKTTFLGTLSVPLDLKILDKNAARAFIFINAGSIGMGNQSIANSPASSQHGYGNSIVKGFSRFWGSHGAHEVPFFGYLRASVGAGIALTLSPAVTLEATYSVPVLKASHDNIKLFQLGVGLSLS